MQIRALVIVHFALLMLNGSSVFCQSGRISFNRYTRLDGLSNNEVTAIHQDKRGFLWIGTKDGLNRFDGRNFVNYSILFPGVQDSITANFIRCLTGAENGRLWVGTQDGLCSLDPMTEEITPIPFQEELRNKLYLPVVTALACYQDQYLRWAGGNGLFLYDRSQKCLKPAPGLINEDFLFKGKIIVHRILPDGHRLWLATSAGLCLYDTLSHLWEEIKVAPDYRIQPGQPIPGVDLRLSHGKLWMTTWGFGLAEVDLSLKKIMNFHLPIPEKFYNASFNILGEMARTPYPGEQNILWISGTTGSLLAFDLNTMKFKSYSAKNWDDPFGVYMAGMSIYFGNPGGLWIGANTGLYQYEAGQQRVSERVFIRDRYPTDEQPVFVDKIYADPADSSGNTLWIGTNNRGFFRYHLQDDRYEMVNNLFNGLLPPTYFVSSVHRDHKQRLWVSTLLNGILCKEEKEGRTRRLDLSQNGRPIKWIVKVIPDKKEDSILWAATASGIFRLNKENGAFEQVVIRHRNMDWSNGHIQDLFQDDHCNLWFIASSKNPRTDLIGKLAQGTFAAAPILTLEHTGGETPLQPHAIIADHKGRVWLSTERGLYFFDSSESQPVLTLFRSPAAENGIRSNEIIRDQFGNIWILSGNRIYLLDTSGSSMQELIFPPLQSATNLSLQENRLNGKILAGTWNRFFVIEPADKQRFVRPGKLYIIGLRTETGYYQNRRADYTNRSVRLPYKNNSVTLEFTSVDFNFGNKPRFYYRMEGYEDTWNTTSNTSISYKLLPGPYRFHLRLTNPGEHPDHETVFTDILIRPPFYKTAWFLGLAAFLLTFLIYAMHRYRLGQLMRMQQLRNTISHNLHDEIGSTLTSISILGSVSQKALEKDPAQAREMLRNITLQSKSIQQTMSDIVWAIRGDNDKIENLLVRMREYAAQTLEPLQINTQFQVNDSLLEKALPLQTRKEVLLIYKEAVNNIARHAGATNVEIFLDRKQQQFLLCIRDNGQWKGHGNSSGTGTRSMQHRASMIGGTINIIPASNGTGVELWFPVR